MLRFAPALTLALFLVPIGAGIVGTALPAFGYLPALGGRRPTLAPWRELVAYPGFGASLRLTVTTGLLATVLAVTLALGTCAVGQGRRWFARLEGVLAPVLAMPHSALAIGFAFLVAPSGWLVRLVALGLPGWQRPPDLVTVQDPAGLAMVAGLLLKETPYLLLMTLAALGQAPVRRSLEAARTLGYAPGVAWTKAVLPQLYPQLRLPIYAVLAFSLSVVDVALILGPSNPPPLAVLALRWFGDPEMRLYFPAAAAACLQLVVVVAAIGLWRAGELVLAAIGRWWLARGGRGASSGPLGSLAALATLVLLVLSGLSLAGMALWSVAAAWRYPAALPTAWTLDTWERQLGGLLRPGLSTAALGLAATLAAVALALACLENEQRRRLRPGSGALWLLYLPLLVPQIAFLFGTQVILLRLGLDGSWAAIVWSHLLFVLPYVFLSLGDPWRALDPRFARAALCLGASPGRVFRAVKLPMLLRPVLVAASVGFAVSVGQYLPTLFAGNGRIATLTTEAVALSAGADRRIIGVYAFLQSLLPLLAYAAAAAAPALLFRHRRGLALR